MKRIKGTDCVPFFYAFYFAFNRPFIRNCSQDRNYPYANEALISGFSTRDKSMLLQTPAPELFFPY